MTVPDDHDQQIGADSTAPDAARPELRLALAMRGGVSLAVWMGGACAEIDALRRAAQPPPGEGDDEATGFWREVLAQSPYSRVVVDVIAGASAGGLNGVVFGAAIRHGFPMADLLGIWRDVAGVEELRRRDAPWWSLFDGDRRFLDRVHAELHRLVASARPAASELPSAPTPTIDLQLTATLVEPVSQPATSPVDEALRRRRSSARFHFRHDPDAAFPRTDLDDDRLAHLAVAARASASFPFAFEAAVVRSTRPDRFELGPGADEAIEGKHPHRWVDLRAVFSERQGSGRGRGASLHPDDFVVADGGILDNIPIARALDAVRHMPATGPTRRVLVYLHPTGPAVERRGDDAAATARDRRGPRALLAGLLAARVHDESIDDDLERIEDANRNLRLRRQARRAAADRLSGEVDLLDVARGEVGTYREQRAVVDADEVRAMLRDPLLVLGGDPFPVDPTGEGDDRWRAPLAQWPAPRRLVLDEVLRATFRGRLDRRPDLASFVVAGLGPLGRTVDLLTELALAVEAMTLDPEARAEVGAQKAAVYRLGGLVRELDRIRRIGWVTVAARLVETGTRSPGGAPSDDPVASVKRWVTASLDDLNLLLRCEPSVASALVAPPSGVPPAEVAAARQAFLDGCERRLQGLASVPAHPEPVTDDAVDLRWAITDALDRAASELVARWPADTAAAWRSGDDAEAADVAFGAALVQQVLATAADPAERFGALEVLLGREHLLGPSAGVEVSFVRLSAAAPTVGARRFARLHEVSARLAPDHTDDDHLLPEVKLAGNELANFAAFVDERWRVNDWQWGRMDAVPTLVDLVLGVDRPASSADRSWGGPAAPSVTDDERRAWIGRRQAQVAAEMVAGAGRPFEEACRRWDVGLETLVVPGSRQARRSAAGLGGAGVLVLGTALARPRLARVLRVPASWIAGHLARPRGGVARGRSSA